MRKRSEVVNSGTRVPEPEKPEFYRDPGTIWDRNIPSGGSSMEHDAGDALAEEEGEAHAKELEEQRAGEMAFAEAAGTSVEVTWGDELFQPVQYNGMRVGPFKATTIARPGESVAQAVARLHRELQEAAKVLYKEKLDAYLKNLTESISAASKARIP